ncbi:hypothetical protein FRC04_009843 [Tulasnella sp. 424]|nr:hypothetical protein FRC04_009843 [Tulasnella sp. 424]KAG8972911.1 hypothetical protein FRC05_009465 [Tulasnella sp. 425]
MTTRIARASLPARLTRLSSGQTAFRAPARHGYPATQFALGTRSFGVSPACRATHYDALGLPRGANKREIKTAFYKLSKELHPDRNPEADAVSKEKYLKASEAYAILVDDRKRRAYDRTLDPSSGSHAPTHASAPHHHWTNHADLSRRPRASYAWDLPRRPRATASPHPHSHTHTHPHRANPSPSGKAYHYPNARRTSTQSSDSRAETEYERVLAAEERVRKDSGFLRTLQVAGLITAVAAVAGFAKG